jgi:tetratricopeptide (TPR) repeat protein
VFVLAFCAAFLMQQPEAISLLGKPLAAPAISDTMRKDYELKLIAAKEDYEIHPNDVDKCVWVGRRIAYLGRFREAVAFYTESLEKFGPNAKLLRHRGHRYITLRQFDKAIADFTKAAELIRGKPDEIEPDGMPNAQNKPIGSLHSNIHYHLALAHYLNGNYDKALAACLDGIAISHNQDRLVSQSYWTYLTYRKLGFAAQATAVLQRINADMAVIENGAYLRLHLFFKGEISEDEALNQATGSNDLPTTHFGIGAFHLANGDKARAKKHFDLATSGKNWPAFGFIAAEAELARFRN